MRNYLDLAQTALEAGFTSEASRKVCLDYVNRAFEQVGDHLRTALLNLRDAEDRDMTDEENGLYYDFPMYPHQYNAKIAARVAAFEPTYHREAQALRDFRDAVKAVEIIKAERNTDAVRVESIRKNIIDQMAYRQARYVEELDMARTFNNLPVTVTAHYVTNQFGHTFIRYFFYLRGKLTALNTIMAVADTINREQEAAAL